MSPQREPDLNPPSPGYESSSDQNAAIRTVEKSPFFYRTIWFSVRLGELWMPEVLSFAISLSLFGVFWHLLEFYNGRPVSDWETGSGVSSIFATLPSAISFLTTLMRGAMMFPVASAIGQWKWHQYRRGPRSLVEFDSFDRATRGITGSITFLMSRNFWSPASVGCVLMIVGIFFGPFLQNTIRQELQWHVATNETAFLPVTREYSVQSSKSSFEDPRLLAAPVSVQAAIGRGWFFGNGIEKGGNDLSTHVHAECPTTECNWDVYTSLMLRSWCVEAEIETTVVETSLGNNITVATSEAAGLSTTRQHPRNESATLYTRLNTHQSARVPDSSYFAQYRDEFAILAHVGAIGNFHDNGTNMQAVECIMYWNAVRGYANFTNGELTNSWDDSHATPETGVEISADDTIGFANLTLKAPWPCTFNSTSDSDSSCEFTVTSRAQRGLYNSLLPYFEGWSADFWNEGDDPQSSGTTTEHSDLLTDVLFWGWVVEIGDSEKNLMVVIDRYISNVAFFTTSTIRMITEGGEMTPGEVKRGLVHFRVNRDFIILPGVMLCVSIAFFLLAVYWTWKEQAWRNSQLPLLFHGLERTGPEEWSATRMTSMWESAYQTKVSLQRGESNDGPRLVRYLDEPDESPELPGYSIVGENNEAREAKGPQHATWRTWSFKK